MIWWPLHRWIDSVGIASTTRRESVLGGRFGRPDETDLGSLRKFVASLEMWPDSAAVTKHSGAMIGVEFFEPADPMVLETKTGSKP
jgi:hypothetical protein